MKFGMKTDNKHSERDIICKSNVTNMATV